MRLPDIAHPRDFLIRNIRRGGIFLVIGALGFVVDGVVYNLLVFFEGQGPLYAAPLLAKTLAVAAGLVVTFAGNRMLTYRDRKTSLHWGQVLRYGVVNALAVAVQLACLGMSRYVLGFDSILADNISGTLIGQALATAMRYVLYTLWVFPHSAGDDPITLIEEHHDRDEMPRP